MSLEWKARQVLITKILERQNSCLCDSGDVAQWQVVSLECTRPQVQTPAQRYTEIKIVRFRVFVID